MLDLTSIILKYDNPIPCLASLFDAMSSVKKLVDFHHGNGLLVGIVHVQWSMKAIISGAGVSWKTVIENYIDKALNANIVWWKAPLKCGLVFFLAPNMPSYTNDRHEISVITSCPVHIMHGMCIVFIRLKKLNFTRVQMMFSKQQYLACTKSIIILAFIFQVFIVRG